MAQQTASARFSQTLDSILLTFDDIKTSGEILTEEKELPPLVPHIAQDMQAFFAGYGVDFPLLTDSQSNTLAYMQEKWEGLPAATVQAVHDAVKLFGKVTYAARDVKEDPCPYVAGTAALLSGLPLEELAGHPDKDILPFLTLSGRDKISYLISLENDLPLEEQYMLSILGNAQVQEKATQLQTHGVDPYKPFLMTVLDNVYHWVCETASATGPSKSVAEAIRSISGLADAALAHAETAASPNGNGHRVLTEELLYTIAAAADPVATAERLLGGPVQAMYAHGDTTGGNRAVGFVVGEGSAVQHVGYQFGSQSLPQPVADSLLKIHSSLPATNPTHPSSKPHRRAATILPHFSER